MIFKDEKNHFNEYFNPNNGYYMRSGVIDDKGNDTGVDPFMRCFPALIDVGVMGKCVCSHLCNVDCYQNAAGKSCNNMSVADFKTIVEQCKDKVFQFALGGAGDVDTHENFEELLKISREAGIIPNFTTSGIAMTDEKAAICKKYCGAVAVSEHHADYTRRALTSLIKAGVMTNLHYVLNNESIDDAIYKLEHDAFMKGLTAVTFLLYKPVGLGKQEKVLKINDPRLKKFFKLVDTKELSCKIGFDSCHAPAVVNFSKNIDPDSMDYCEAARFSMYIDAKMNAMPCSFANDNPKWFVSLKEHSIQEAWDGEVFSDWRSHFIWACPDCPNRANCGGGCPICKDVTLCNNKERTTSK